MISIVTCTYNSEKYLEKCLKSVESQSYKNIEHIFNDSYSTDNTLKIIEEYTARNKDKYQIKFMQSEPKGVAHALNIATPMATGDIIHYLHSDDYYASNDALEKVAELFRVNPDKQWLTGNFLVEVRGKKIKIPHTPLLKVDPKTMLSFMNFIHHENTFVKKDLVKQYGGFNETKGQVVEYGIWLKLIRDHKPLIVNDEFTVFIINKDSTSTGDLLKFSKAIMRAFKTQHKENVFPLVGYYGNKRVYRELRKIRRQVKKIVDYLDQIA